MALQKQNFSLTFGQGLDTKTDPWQVPLGKFLSLENSVFTKGGQLQKRNGFGLLSPVDVSASTITTYQDGLTAIGERLYDYSGQSNQWEDKGRIQPMSLSVLPIVRNSLGQSNVDIAISFNNLSCAVYIDGDSIAKYTISDYATGRYIVYNTPLPTGASSPRVFILGSHFIVTFLVTVSSTPHLQYIAIPILNVANPGPATDISSQVHTNAGYDGYVENNKLYIAWAGSDVGNAIRVTDINSALQQANTVVLAGHTATLMSVTVDNSGSTAVVWVTAYASDNAYSYALNQNLVTILAATQTITSTDCTQITSVATAGVLSLYYEVLNTYSYSSVRTDYISMVTCTQIGTVSSPIVTLRSVGIASKAFLIGSTIYLLAVYGGAFQPTFFLIDGNGNAVAKLAYENAGGYITGQVLPGANVTGNSVQIGYLYKDLIQALNATQGASVAGVYSEAGVNLVSIVFENNNIITSEISQTLQISGGLMWSYDGTFPTELGFNVWPEDEAVTTSSTGGNITADEYFYQITYEWTDSQGNINRSAPSVPISITTTGSTSSNTLNIPTLRVTYKTQVRIVIYRWSTNQEVYYQVTSISSPLLNDPTVDSVTFVDTQADSAILGNDIIYVTGGVVENIAPPGSDIFTLFDTRLFLVDDEDPNLLWYSKQSIEDTPVETSDLFTIYIAPTVGSQGSTGPITALFPMDDKLIIFKENAIVYFNGTGPDNTGANSQYAPPALITGTVGCDNMQSIVFMPNGLMFQSNKGIWLLGRDLNTTYIGAPVEAYTTGSLVLSALAIPGTNQVRFTMDSGVMLMYDYFFQQWGTFVGIPAVSGTVFEELHTILNKYGEVLQETPGQYLDNSTPVLMSFDTSWVTLAGLQGYERFYFFYILGQYLTPFKLNVQVAFDYNPSPQQTVLITPTNTYSTWGSDPLWGDSAYWGGASNVFEERVFASKQRCESFQLQITEVYDPSQGVAAGAGLTLSGLNLVAGIKRGYRNSPAVKNAG